MLINLSLEMPIVFDDSKVTIFEKNRLEVQLTDYLSSYSWDLYVIVWPWNFSTVRVGCCISNIFRMINDCNVYYLNKFEYYKQKWIKNIVMFSWNKNKLLFVKNWDYKKIDIVDNDYLKSLEKQWIVIENSLTILKLEDIYKDYSNLRWHKSNIIKPYYYFIPNVSKTKKSFIKI